jgi:hypothetical protein
MLNNQVKITIDNGPEVFFKFSDIIGLTYSEKGYHATIDIDGQRVNVPITKWSYLDASQYIVEHQRHCKVCGHRLSKEDILDGCKIVFSSYKCPNGHENRVV